jgi:hypothetical protein
MEHPPRRRSRRRWPSVQLVVRSSALGRVASQRSPT